MRKSRLLLAAIVFASIASGFASSHADPCGSAAKDPFGSCESGRDLGYQVHCAAQGAIPSVGALTPETTTPPAPPTPSAHTTPAAGVSMASYSYSNGVETCVDGAGLPAGGRAGVIVSFDQNGDPGSPAGAIYSVHVVAFEDGSETKNPSVTGGWTNVTADSNVPSQNPGAASGSTGSCVKRGETGTWDQGAPNTVDEGVSGAGPTAGC